MPFLVRKLGKMDKLFSLRDRRNIAETHADIPTTEFRTRDGALSTWHIDSLDDIENAVLAIAVSSSEIAKMDFIIISTDILSENSLNYKQTYAGQDIAIPDLQNTHYDIIDVSIEKLINCTKVYQTVVKMDPEGKIYIVRYAAGEIKDLLKKALDNNRVDESKASKKIKDLLDKLKAG